MESNILMNEVARFKRGLVRSSVETDAETFVHPGWASLHSQELRARLLPSQLSELKETVKLKNHLCSWAKDPFRDFFEQSLKRQSHKASVKRGRIVTYTFASETETQAIQLTEALGLLERAWPEQTALFKILVTHVIFFRADAEWSYSDMLTFGAIYYNSDFGTSPLDLAEGLIHEMSHHLLYVKQTFRRLLENPSALCRSPLRPDLRPLDGLFHAVFVLHRILELYARVDKFPDLRAHVPHARVSRYRSDLADGLYTLADLAKFTEFGQALFAELVKSSQMLLSGRQPHPELSK